MARQEAAERASFDSPASIPMSLAQQVRGGAGDKSAPFEE
jgi:hypothetical protein